MIDDELSERIDRLGLRNDDGTIRCEYCDGDGEGDHGTCPDCDGEGITNA